jgi:hypothetical protein
MVSKKWKEGEKFVCKNYCAVWKTDNVHLFNNSHSYPPPLLMLVTGTEVKCVHPIVQQGTEFKIFVNMK